MMQRIKGHSLQVDLHETCPCKYCPYVPEWKMRYRYLFGPRYPMGYCKSPVFTKGFTSRPFDDLQSRLTVKNGNVVTEDGIAINQCDIYDRDYSRSYGHHTNAAISNKVKEG